MGERKSSTNLEAYSIRPGGEEATRRSAKPLCEGANPSQASRCRKQRVTRRGGGMVDAQRLKRCEHVFARVGPSPTPGTIRELNDFLEADRWDARSASH